MTISETQLQTWSGKGAQVDSQRTYNSIREALGRFTWPSGTDSEIYLQGSYRNDTNIRGESDVDVVVQLNSAFYRDLSELPAQEIALYEKSFSAAVYVWEAFRADVLSALRAYFGTQQVREGKKSLKAQTPYLPADVVVCAQHRKYRRFRSVSDQDYVEGITFYVPTENRWIVNYPKLHCQHGVDKQAATGDRFKPTVRVLKNARSYLVDKGAIGDDVAPSYFIECLAYNAPNLVFGDSHQRTYMEIMSWFVHTDHTKLVCQNGQLPLFGNSPEQWREAQAMKYIIALFEL